MNRSSRSPNNCGVQRLSTAKHTFRNCFRDEDHATYVDLDHTRAVSRWFVIPIALIWARWYPSFSNSSTVRSTHAIDVSTSALAASVKAETGFEESAPRSSGFSSIHPGIARSVMDVKGCRRHTWMWKLLVELDAGRADNFCLPRPRRESSVRPRTRGKGTYSRVDDEEPAGGGTAVDASDERLHDSLRL